MAHNTQKLVNPKKRKNPDGEELHSVPSKRPRVEEPPSNIQNISADSVEVSNNDRIPEALSRYMEGVQWRIDHPSECTESDSDVLSIHLYDDDSLWNSIRKSELARNSRISDDVIGLIVGFGSGDIIHCAIWDCEATEHVDDPLEANERGYFCKGWHYWTNPWPWESHEDAKFYCHRCYREYLCTICHQVLSSSNYECDECGHVFCSSCDNDGGDVTYHEQVHRGERDAWKAVSPQPQTELNEDNLTTYWRKQIHLEEQEEAKGKRPSWNR